MGRPSRRESDIDLDPDQFYSYRHKGAADPHGDTYPPRGRSPGPRRRNRSVPAATAASMDESDRHLEPKEPREGRKHRRDRTHHRDYGAEEHAGQVDPRQERHYNDVRGHNRRARSHGQPDSVPYRAAGSYEDSDTYAPPASRRGRERHQAYHPPRTSETRRSKYPDYDMGPRSGDMRQPRHSQRDFDYRMAEPRSARYPGFDGRPHAGDRRRSRDVSYDGGLPRGGGESNRARYPDYDAGARSHPRQHTTPSRGRRKSYSPDANAQPTKKSSARGRSMPRNIPGHGGGRLRAKSAVDYAALGEAAQTAFRVGSQAAYRMRNEPGPWIGEKGTRVATAALGAALVDTFVGHKAVNMKGGMRHQALRQACEMGIRNFVMQPAVNSASHRNQNGGDGNKDRRRR